MVDPTGYTALDLIGFTDKGDYNPLSTYLKNDLANFNGTKWRCKADDTTGVTPSEGLTWTAFMVLPTDHTMDMIAPIETSPSANAYVTGKQLIFNEVLYDVIDDITIGDTLEVGVNIDTSDTIVEKIEAANGAIAQNASDIDDIDDEISAICNVYGSKNLLPYPYKTSSYSNRGVDFTSNANGSILINGSNDNTNNSIYQLHGAWASTTLILPAGKYIISTGTDNSDITISVCYNDTILRTITGEEEVNAPNGISYITCEVAKGKSVSNVTAYPMITDARIKDRTYVPYAPTNRDCMSYAVNTKLGAHNLLPTTATTTTLNDVTWTVNTSNGAITPSGTPTGYSGIIIGKARVTNTRYILSGLAGTNNIKWGQVVLYDSAGTQLMMISEVPYADSLKDYYLDLSAYPTAYALTVEVKRYVENIACSGTIYPLLTVAEDTDRTFAPHAMTNRELTERKDATITASTNAVNLTYVYLRKIGKLVIVTGFMIVNSQVSTGVTLGTFSTDFAPIDSLVYPPIVQSGNTGVTRGVRMLTDGTITSGDFVIPAGTYTINSSYFTK